MKFDFFKKKEVDSLDTPKNLPELAKDMFEPQSADASVDQKNDTQKNNAQKNDSSIKEPVQPNPVEYKMPVVPVSSGVPRLDLNLIRNSNINSSSVPPSDISDVQMSDGQSNWDNRNNQPLPNIQNSQNSQRVFASQEPINIINLPKTTLNAQSSNQSNIYIHKGNSLFDDLESAIANNKEDVARNIINNIIPLLYEYHDVDSMNDSDRIKELKDLERLWTMLQKKNYAVKMMIDSIESDILRKSNSLLTSNRSRNIIAQASPVRSSGSSSSYSLGASSNFQPVFVPIIKNSATSSLSATSNSEVSSSLNSLAPVYVPPHERFYFKDGKVASSLRELYYNIIDISDDTFYHHVSIERNDFANWIKDVLKQYSIAKEIANIYSRRELIEFLKDKI